MAIDSASREMLLARAEARLLLQQRRESLLDFIPRVSPQWDSPRHLAPFAELLERALREPLMVCVSTPPQHGKTECVKHGLAYLLRRWPRRRNAYVTYEAGRAEAVSLETQRIATEAGVSWRGSRKRWFTPEGGGLLATGVGGPLTGYGVDGLLVVDDPLKNRQEAESATIREQVHSWFTSTALTRVHPTASVVIVATRWHPDDLTGRVIEKDGWQYINLPAVSDGKALWEERRPLAWLERKREQIGEYDWAALYQGMPRNRGDAIFHEAVFSGERPGRYTVSIGVDFAYSSKTYSDYSAAVVLAHESRDDDEPHRCWVLDVVRRQLSAPEFLNVLKELKVKFQGAQMAAYVGGTEKGIVDFMSSNGVDIDARSATEDKFTRAQPVAAAWNSGRILLPESGAWIDPFVSEVAAFTGVKDRHDDQVDALASAFNAGSGGVAIESDDISAAFPPPRWGNQRGF